MKNRSDIHRGKVKKMIENEKVMVLLWVARSSDINSMKTLCESISRRVYYGDKKFEKIAALDDHIQDV